MKNTTTIQVSGKVAQKLQKLADAKAAKLKAIRQKPIQDLSKMTPVG